MARNATSAFRAVHRGLTEEENGAARTASLVLAVHGFHQRQGDPSVLVSSAGTTQEVMGARNGLEKAFSSYGLEVAAFPDEVGRLGGLSTVQGRHLTVFHGRLPHVELSETPREQVAESLEFQQRFAEPLQRGLRPPVPGGDVLQHPLVFFSGD